MTSILAAPPQGFEALTQDVNEIYNNKDKLIGSQEMKREYSFNEKRVDILFKFAWTGKLFENGIDMKASTEIHLHGAAKKSNDSWDSRLLHEILNIILRPVDGEPIAFKIRINGEPLIGYIPDKTLMLDGGRI